MCAKVKYGIWNVKQPDMGAVNALVGAGYAPLSAMVLACRGIESGDQAKKYLDCHAPLLDPFLMTDMALAAGRVAMAMEKKEKIAVLIGIFFENLRFLKRNSNAIMMNLI